MEISGVLDAGSSVGAGVILSPQATVIGLWFMSQLSLTGANSNVKSSTKLICASLSHVNAKFCCSCEVTSGSASKIIVVALGWFLVHSEAAAWSWKKVRQQWES